MTLIIPIILMTKLFLTFVQELLLFLFYPKP